MVAMKIHKNLRESVLMIVCIVKSFDKPGV